MVFLDRRDAVRQLAEQLIALKGEDPVVIALPPGGVPVAFEVAQRLGAPLDGLPVGSAPAPGNSQLAAGATTEDGVVALDAPTEPVVSMTDDLFDAAFARERRMLRLRAAGYRSGRPSIDVRGRTVIVVDDGARTEVERLAAVRTLRARWCSDCRGDTGWCGRPGDGHRPRDGHDRVPHSDTRGWRRKRLLSKFPARVRCTGVDAA